MEKKEYLKKYYEENKPKIKKYYSKKIECPICGALYTRSNVTNHKKSKKHIKAINNDLEGNYIKLKKDMKMLVNIEQKYQKIKEYNNTLHNYEDEFKKLKEKYRNLKKMLEIED
nr:hypothetical protein GUARANI_17 [Guarani virophage]